MLACTNLLKPLGISKEHKHLIPRVKTLIFPGSSFFVCDVVKAYVLNCFGLFCLDQGVKNKESHRNADTLTAVLPKLVPRIY